MREALLRVSAIGIEWERSRFGQYVWALNEAASPQPSEGAKLLMFEAASQLTLLLFSSACWDSVEPRLLRRTLEQVFSGPATVDSPDDKPRNTLLELTTAACLKEHGFEVALTDEKEDVGLRHPAVGYGAVECKRPTKIDSVLSNLQKIGKQLRHRRRDGANFGVAVIGADRLLEPSTVGFSADSLEEVRAATDEIIRHLSLYFLEQARTVGCDLIPDAEIGVIIFSHAVVISPLLILHPFCVVAPFPLIAPGSMPPGLDAMFTGDTMGPLTKYLIRRSPIDVTVK